MLNALIIFNCHHIQCFQLHSFRSNMYQIFTMITFQFLINVEYICVCVGRCVLAGDKWDGKRDWAIDSGLGWWVINHLYTYISKLQIYRKLPTYIFHLLSILFYPRKYKLYEGKGFDLLILSKPTRTMFCTQLENSSNLLQFTWINQYHY